MPFLSKKNTDACHQNSNTVVHGRSIMSSAVSPALIVIFISFYFHYFLNWLRDSIYLEIDGSSKIVTEFMIYHGFIIGDGFIQILFWFLLLSKFHIIMNPKTRMVLHDKYEDFV
jgi:hypothetical protein